MMKKKIFFIFWVINCILICACNEKTNNEPLKDKKVSDDCFEWEGNTIIALSEYGMKQEVIIIPERCEGFDGMIFADKENNAIEVSFESDKDIKLNGVFGCAEKLKRIELPKELTCIGDLEFWLCSSLEEIRIPKNVSNIGAYAFQNNAQLTNVIFDGEISEIMPHAFEGCTSLEKIVLPDSVSAIGDYAFYSCMALKKVKLPESLAEVGEFAFANSGLEEVHVSENVILTKYSTTSYIQVDKSVDVYVKEGSWMDLNFEKIFKGAFEKNIAIS